MTTMLAELPSWPYPPRDTEFQKINGDLPEADFWTASLRVRSGTGFGEWRLPLDQQQRPAAL